MSICGLCQLIWKEQSDGGYPISVGNYFEVCVMCHYAPCGDSNHVIYSYYPEQVTATTTLTNEG